MASQQGFTLLELTVMVAVLGVLSAYAVIKYKGPAPLTLTSQAETLASDLRRAQALAYSSGQRMRVTPTAGTNGSYAVACVTGTTPCSSDFSASFSHSVVLAGSTLYFNSLGQPSDSTGSALSGASSFTLTYDTATKTVSVAAQTGLVTVTP
jgi:prepilin-type N-terminal cleavage/methylation domain-containing protein